MVVDVVLAAHPGAEELVEWVGDVGFAPEGVHVADLEGGWPAWDDGAKMSREVVEGEDLGDS